MELYLIQCGRTHWPGEPWMQGRVSLPLSEVGVEQAESAVRQLGGVELAAVYTPPDEACQATAALIARPRRGLRRRIRKLDELAELDLGLWQGLSADDLKRRQPKVYRRWLAEPEAVTPPGGESFESARQRAAAAIERIAARHAASAEAVAIVARPLAAALLRGRLAGANGQAFWAMVRADAAEVERFVVGPESDAGAA